MSDPSKAAMEAAKRAIAAAEPVWNGKPQFAVYPEIAWLMTRQVAYALDAFAAQARRDALGEAAKVCAKRSADWDEIRADVQNTGKTDGGISMLKSTEAKLCELEICTLIVPKDNGRTPDRSGLADCQGQALSGSSPPPSTSTAPKKEKANG